MDMKFSEEEAEVLLRLVYLGGVVVNGCRRVPLGEYDALSEKLYSQYLAAGAGKREKALAHGLTCLHPVGNETADLRDRVYDEVKGLLEDYDAAVFRERIKEAAEHTF